MSAPIDASGLDRLIGQTLQALGQARGAPGPNGSDDEPIKGVGQDPEGFIKATAVVGGKLSDLEIDPRVLRLTSVSLSEAIVAAVNAALADLQAKIKEAAGAPDLDALAETLKEVQQESSKQMGTFLQALTDAQERIAASGRQR